MAGQYATAKDLAVMEAQHDAWLDSLDLSHVKPLDDNWEEHPFWADEKDMKNPETAAGKFAAEMQQECTPQERAEGCKDSGNELLKRGQHVRKKALIRDASKKYREGVAILAAAGAEAPALRCALLSNAAHAEALLCNWRNSLDCALRAIGCDAAHIKSYMRGARAALQLKRWQLAHELCARGLQVEPGAAELLRMQGESETARAQQELRDAAEREARERRLAPVRALAAALAGRGYRVTRPQFHQDSNSESKQLLPWLDGDGGLHFPVVLFYPEAQPYNDRIEDFGEHDTFAAHLDQMFAPEAGALPFDEKQEYTRETVDVYYMTHVGQPLTEAQIVDALQGKWPTDFDEDGPQAYGEKAARLQRVRESSTLADVLQAEDHVMPGIPVFWVVSRGSAYAARFLESFQGQ